ncbi:MAG: AAA family ATPase [Bacteroidota bacterium]
MPNKTINYQDLEINLAQPFKINQRKLIGRTKELELIKCAWNIKESERKWHIPAGTKPMNLKLIGAPGFGKNTIAEFAASKLEGYTLFSITGHESLEPEDMILSIIPRTDSKAVFTLQASPLLTALLTRKSILFFDELNRVPERTLSVLSSLLDHRRALFSGLTNRWFEQPDDADDADFIFIAALNPTYHSSLPDYIDQRLLPSIDIGKPSIEEVVQIIKYYVKPTETLLNLFIQYYMENEMIKNISIRQCISMMELASRQPMVKNFTDLEKYIYPLN